MLIPTWWIDALYKQYNTCILIIFYRYKAHFTDNNTNIS